MLQMSLQQAAKTCVNARRYAVAVHMQCMLIPGRYAVQLRVCVVFTNRLMRTFAAIVTVLKVSLWHVPYACV